MQTTLQALIYFDLQNKTNPGSHPTTLQGSVCVPHQLLLLWADSLLLTSDIISWLKYLLCFRAQCVCHYVSRTRFSGSAHHLLQYPTRTADGSSSPLWPLLALSMVLNHPLSARFYFVLRLCARKACLSPKWQTTLTFNILIFNYIFSKTYFKGIFQDQIRSFL